MDKHLLSAGDLTATDITRVLDTAAHLAKVTDRDSRIAGIIYELLGRDLAQKMRRSNTRRVLLQDESDVL